MRVRELMEKAMVNRLYERSREYEFVFRYIAPLLLYPKPFRKFIRILDVGGGESRLANTLADLGFDVTVIDIGDVDHGSAKFVRANILEYDFPQGCFNLIIAISTIEHIGLPAYGQKILDADGDVETVRKLKKWLAPGGILLITVPYGRPHHPPDFERVYNRESIWRLGVWDLEILEKSFYCYNRRDPHDFLPCRQEEAEKTDAVLCIAARKPE